MTTNETKLVIKYLLHNNKVQPYEHLEYKVSYEPLKKSRTYRIKNLNILQNGI